MSMIAEAKLEGYSAEGELRKVPSGSLFFLENSKVVRKSKRLQDLVFCGGPGFEPIETPLACWGGDKIARALLQEMLIERFLPGKRIERLFFSCKISLLKDCCAKHR